MLRMFVEEASALASIVLFVGMVAVWAQLIPQTFVNEVRRTGESENSRVGVGVSNGLTRCKPSPFIRCGSACADSPR